MSLHQAANQMGMSYSKAWRLIQTLEERLGFRSFWNGKSEAHPEEVPRSPPKGKALMNHYERFRKDVEEGIEKIYQKHFGSMEKKGRK